MIKTLKDDYSGVRKEAAWALSLIGDERAVEPLIAILGYWHNTKFVIEVLSKIKNIRAVGPLIKVLKNEHKDWYIREEAALALAGMGNSRAVEFLIEALSDEDRDVRKGAARTLGLIKDKKAVDHLIEALKDEDWYVRAEATEALGLIEDERAVKYLIEAFKNKGWVIREKTAEALVSIGTQAIEPLIKVLEDDDEDWYVRMEAAKALNEIGGIKVQKVLNVFLKSVNLKRVADNYKLFIRRGEPDTESLLIFALGRYGSETMAKDFFYCGNEKLEVAAMKWAEHHNYSIPSGKKESIRWESLRLPLLYEIRPPQRDPFAGIDFSSLWRP